MSGVSQPQAVDASYYPAIGQVLRVGREVRIVTWVSGSFVTYRLPRRGSIGSTRVGSFIRWARKATALPAQAG
jgi:hypothetical protein